MSIFQITQLSPDGLSIVKQTQFAALDEVISHITENKLLDFKPTKLRDFKNHGLIYVANFKIEHFKRSPVWNPLEASIRTASKGINAEWILGESPKQCLTLGFGHFEICDEDSKMTKLPCCYQDLIVYLGDDGHFSPIERERPKGLIAFQGKLFCTIYHGEPDKFVAKRKSLICDTASLTTRKDFFDWWEGLIVGINCEHEYDKLDPTKCPLIDQSIFEELASSIKTVGSRWYLLPSICCD